MVVHIVKIAGNTLVDICQRVSNQSLILLVYNYPKMPECQCYEA